MGSVLVRGGGLADVRLDQEALGNDDLVAGREARGDFDLPAVAPAQRHRPLLVAVAFAHVDHVAAALVELQRGDRDRQRDVGAVDHDPRAHRGPRPPQSVAVVDAGARDRA